MSSRKYPSSPLLAACTAIWRDGKILLALRDRSPNQGTWAMPGGLVEVGETLKDAAIREVKEETALDVSHLVFNKNHEIIMRDEDGKVEVHYVLAMFATDQVVGDAVAGDDAADVRWFTLDELASAPLTGNTLQFANESAHLLSNTSQR
jgi:ADP-ribose pyrophosphatase YjhB (NUDIX family)